MIFLLNVLVSAAVISAASWLSGRFPVAAGFMVALPLATMLVLPLSYFEHESTATSVDLARSIFIASPISLCFFLPFLTLERFGLSFWSAYAIGCVLLPIGFFVHRAVAKLFF